MTSWVNAAQSSYAIAIGINQYQHFQPLSYAQRDAQAVRDFLVNEAGFDPGHVLLFTDTSPAIEQAATYPSRNNLQTGIARLSQQLRAGNLLWLFFSGYGVRFEGQDYLMPIEGDPTQIPNTGIAIADVFSTLQAAASDNILIALDMSRSSSTIAGAAVGEQTATLAKNFGIVTLLSCQPGQFSHETLGLRQGLFTAALLEGLRHRGCLTPEHLAQYLGDRLPELSEHHWRPKQEPLAIVPAEKKYQLILPGKAPVTAGNGYPGLGTRSAQTLPPNPVQSASAAGGTPNQLHQPTLPIAIPTGLPNRPLGNGSEPTSTAVIPVTTSSTSQSPSSSDADPLFWQRLLTWGGIIAGLLLLGVLLRNWAEFTQAPAPVDPTPTPATASPTASASPTAGTPDPQTPPTASPTAPTPDASAVPFTTQPSPDTTPSPSPDATAPIAPTAPNPPTPAPLPNSTGAPTTSAASALDEARAAVERSIATSPNTQVSAFNDAIERARSIPIDDPLYAQAQRDIDRWSQVILSVAEQRASQGNGGSRRRAVRNYRSAIEAAQLVPRDRPALYARAQRLIAAWNQRLDDLGY